MLYHDPIFLWLFMPAYAVGHYILARHSTAFTLLWLYSGSLIFYAWTKLSDLTLLAAVTLTMIIGAWVLTAFPRTWVFATIIAILLAPLTWFKYAAFLSGEVEWGAVSGTSQLPIGLSFYTFQAIAYVFGVYRRVPSRIDALETASFLAFFPQLIAGPIVLPREFIPQIRHLRLNARPVLANIAVGGAIFIVGFSKMTLLAEPISRVSDYAFARAAIGVPDLVTAWIGALAYSLQIYFDFSAYSDMAIGVSRILGIRLPINFWSPYQSRSIIDFWRRWHITLGRFLRICLYIPLGGNRHGLVRQTGAIIMTMIIGGIWHGAGWTFILWGAIHGVALAVTHALPTFNRFWLPHIVRSALTFLFVTVAWVPFRSENFDVLMNMVKGLSFQGMIAVPTWTSGIFLPVFGDHLTLDGRYASTVLFSGGTAGAMALIAGTVIVLFAPNIYQLLAIYRPGLHGIALNEKFPAWLRRARVRLGVLTSLALLVMFGVSLWYAGPPQQFLYFQF